MMKFAVSNKVCLSVLVSLFRAAVCLSIYCQLHREEIGEWVLGAIEGHNLRSSFCLDTGLRRGSVSGRALDIGLIGVSTCGFESHQGPFHSLTFPPVLRDWVIKGLGMSSLLYATGHIKGPMPLIEKRRGLSPGGRFPPSFIHQVIIITGLNKLQLYVLAVDGLRCRQGVKPPLNSTQLSFSMWCARGFTLVFVFQQGVTVSAPHSSDIGSLVFSFMSVTAD